MARFLTKTATLVLLALVGSMVSADDGEAVKTSTLTVKEKLDKLELIEVTSEKEIQAVPAFEQDPLVESLLKELDQLDSELDSDDNE